MKFISLFTCGAVIILLAVAGPAQADIPGGVRAVSAGSGDILLYWFPPAAIWPEGGFQIQDQQGKILVKQLLPLNDHSLLNSLPEPERKWLQRIAQNPASLSDRNAGLNGQRLALALKSALSFDFSRALALGHTLSGVSRGARYYRVVGLNKQGRPTRLVMKSTAVDAGIPSPLPAAPGELQATPTSAGIELHWKSPPGKENQVVHFKIARRVKQHGEFMDILDQPLFARKNGKGDHGEALPDFIDDSAPQEQEVEYRVTGVDLFGRSSDPAHVTLFVPAFASLMPPTEITALAHTDGIRIQWSLDKNHPDTRFVIERSSLSGGPFIVLTPQGVKVGRNGYMDKTATAGRTWFYRVKTVTTDGRLSGPSATARAGASGDQAPPAIPSLRARLGISSVVLEWPQDDVKGVAGYLVERRMGRTWQRLNDSIRRENTFTYHYATEDQLEMVFRVRAVGYHNRLGPPSRPVSVKIRKLPRGKPEITAVNRSGNGIEISFDFPRERADIRFIVRRSAGKAEEGIVISPILSAREKQFVDTRVVPGQIYWYRVQALGPQNWSSEYSEAVEIRMPAIEIPTPAQPGAQFLDRPFAHVRVTFAPPPGEFVVVVERRGPGASLWETLSGDGGDGKFLDANPPAVPALEYRIRYKAMDDTPGPPSAPVKVERTDT